MTRILMSLGTVSALALAAPAAVADNHMQNASAQMKMGESASQDGRIRAGNVIGRPIYTVEVEAEDWDEDDGLYQIESELDQIGEVADLVLSHGGELQGAVVEVGGFLDIGDATVMISVDDMRLAAEGEDIAYVTLLSEDELENLPQVEDDYWD